MNLDYDPVAHIQIVRPKNKHKSDVESAVAETVKYPVKDTDFRTDDKKTEECSRFGRRSIQKMVNFVWRITERNS
ncbi:protein rep [Sporosarcina limicola]|uniref:protein rep n=1 Tax=Sporosarcina limicola TaxID=34101 RepID=UPI00178AFB42|nr:protein rep [Sporosarcina limicola]